MRGGRINNMHDFLDDENDNDLSVIPDENDID